MYRTTGDDRPSVIAHSFGTYLVARSIDLYQLVFDRVIFCGAIVPRDYPWTHFFSQGLVRSVLNDYGRQDFWAWIVEYVVEDAGGSGDEGFQDLAAGKVLQREHQEFRHSDYFYERNYRKNWIPFLQGETPEPPLAIDRRPTNRRFRVTAFVVSLALILSISYLGRELYEIFHHPRVSELANPSPPGGSPPPPGPRSVGPVYPGSLITYDDALNMLAGRTDLQLTPALNGVTDIPTSGKSRIIVADVDHVLHFRVFDGDGKVIENTNENMLNEQTSKLKDLRNQLQSLWPPHELTHSEKARVNAAIASIVLENHWVEWTGIVVYAKKGAIGIRPIKSPHFQADQEAHFGLSDENDFTKVQEGKEARLKGLFGWNNEQGITFIYGRVMPSL